MRTKKIPQRKCLGCGENKPKKELIRIVKTAERQVLPDFTGKVNGRGAYICSNINCLDKAIESKKISKSLAVGLSIDEIEQIKIEIKNKIDDKGNTFK